MNAIPKQVLYVLIVWWIAWFGLQTFALYRTGIELYWAVIDAAITTAVLALEAYVVSLTFRFYVPASRNHLYRFGYMVVLTVIVMAALHFILCRLSQNAPEYNEMMHRTLPIRALFVFLMINLMGAVYWLRYFQVEQEEQRKRNDEADRHLREAELSRLRQQLQPHFLFNSLNSISALTVTNPEKARTMVQQLADFFRGTLKKDDNLRITLAEELRQLQLYLEIEKVRFGHRLNTEILPCEECHDKLLPSLILQPVVENAIKFGLYDTTGEVVIRIEARVDRNMLSIAVSNPYDPESAPPRKGTGFGLDGIRRRLYLLYGMNDLLHTRQENRVFTTTIQIPQA